MPNRVIQELKAWRDSEGRRRGHSRALTFEEAAALVVVEGEPVNKSTWHAWETGKKVPSRPAMPVLCDLLGISSDVFYERKRVETAKPPAQQPLLV